jgi:hypothetical protein
MARDEWHAKIVALVVKHGLVERNDPGGKSLNHRTAGRFNVPEMDEERAVFDALMAWLIAHGLEVR